MLSSQKQHDDIAELKFTPKQEQYIFARAREVDSKIEGLRRKAYVAYAIIILASSLGFLGVRDAQEHQTENTNNIAAIISSNKKAVANQLANRVANVATWCGAINNVEEADRQILRRFHLAYPLPPLNCVELEKNTAGSGK